MRFSDFFITYKLGLQKIKSTIPFKEFPMHKKICIVLTFILMVLGIPFLFFNRVKIACMFLLGMLIPLAIFIATESTNKNLENKLNIYYIPYSKERMEMVLELLSNYNILPSDSKKIDLLIEHAKNVQAQSDNFNTLKTPFKTLSALIVPITIYIAKTYANNLSSDEIVALGALVIILIICFYAILFAVTPVFKDFVNKDYNNYEMLISDLKQIKIFYT